MFALQHLAGSLRDFAGWAPLGLPAFLFYITVVVFVHEMGHFLMARFFGARVDVFSIGFGPEIFGWHDKRGTRWRVSWQPVGGYVKFAGDADAASTPDRKAAERPAAEQAGMMAFRPLHQRALVAAAGPFANFVLAVLLFTGIFLAVGHTVQAPLIGRVFENSPAAEAGLRPGDLVVRLDGKAINDFEQLPEIVGLSGGRALGMEVSRAGRAVAVTVTPRLTQTRDLFGDGEKRMTIGITSDPRAPLTTTSYNLPGAFWAACTRTGDIVRLTLKGIGQLVTGRASLEQLRGPVGIAQITRKVALFGLLPFISLIAVLSVSIGLINLFPIPLLDGGHLLYYACEAVLGRPLGERAQDVGFRLGLVLVLGLMLLATWNDLARLNLF